MSKRRDYRALRERELTDGGDFDNAMYDGAQIDSALIDQLKALDERKSDGENSPELEAEITSLRQELSQYRAAFEQGRALSFERCQMSTVGLQVPPDITPEEYSNVGYALRFLSDSLQWMIGDWCVFGDMAWGTGYRDLAEQFGFKVETLRNYKYVAEAVKVSLRSDTLTFSHYQVIAAIRDERGLPDTERQQHWIDRAIENHWTVAQLRAAINPPKRTPSHWKAFGSFKRRISKLIGDMPDQDRQQVASELRALADMIETEDV